MTGTSDPTRAGRVHGLMVAILAALLVACGSGGSVASAPAGSAGGDEALWRLLDRSGDAMPLTASSVEMLTGSPMVLEEQTQYRQRWRGGEVPLGPERSIREVGLLLGPGGEVMRSSAATLHLDGPCVPLQEVRQRYPGLQLVDAPTAHSGEQVSTWAMDKPWGHLRFGFSETESLCLLNVTLAVSDYPYSMGP